VWTHRAIDSPEPPIRVTVEPPANVVASAEAAGHSHLWLVGGGQLATAFRDAGLLTQTIVSIIPATLGSGIPLFAETETPDFLRLEDCRTFETGVVQLTYVPKP